MKKSVILLFVVRSFFSFAQDDKVLDDKEKEAVITKMKTTAPLDTTKTWKTFGLIGLNFNQVSLTNWAGGGTSSIATTGIMNLNANYAKGKTSWVNSLDMAYGIIKNADAPIIKSDDKLEFNSKFGHKASKYWYYSGLLNFRSQFAPGFKTPGDTVKISNFLAPGYLIAAIGMDYKPNDKFSAFLAPLTSKITIVNDPVLSARGAFGVDTNATVRSEFGGFIKLQYQNNIVENVSFATRIDLFSNYLHNPKNIDVSWETLISMKINKFMSASIATHLIYDDDVKISVDENKDGILDGFGPRVQFKEVLAVGLAYKF